MFLKHSNRVAGTGFLIPTAADMPEGREEQGSKDHIADELVTTNQEKKRPRTKRQTRGISEFLAHRLLAIVPLPTA